jgi:hypothetical protein
LQLLEKLGQLHSAGVLTDEEFNSKGQELLSTIRPDTASRSVPAISVSQPTPPTTESAMAARLQRLEVLRDQDLITDEEYQAKLKEILGTPGAPSQEPAEGGDKA